MDEKNEKKTLKERVLEAKRKTKEFWEEHKVAIIKGAVATAVTVRGIVLFKKASDALEPGYPLELDKLDVASGGTIEQKDLVAKAFWKENDMDGFEQQVFGKLTEVNDMCLEKGVTYNVCTSMGCEDWLQNSHYLGHEWYTDDGICLKSEW